MEAVIALNVVLIVLVVIFGACLGQGKFVGGWMAAFIAFVVCTTISMIGWIIYISAHFLAKIW